MKNSIAARILISILGAAFMLWGIDSLALGVIGERENAVLTSIRRQGGERNEALRGRYTYHIGYTFTLPDGRKVDGYATNIGNSVYIKATGTSTIPVRYFKAAPFINMPEKDTKISLGQPVLVIIGAFLVACMNKRHIIKS